MIAISSALSRAVLKRIVAITSTATSISSSAIRLLSSFAP